VELTRILEASDVGRRASCDELTDDRLTEDGGPVGPEQQEGLGKRSDDLRQALFVRKACLEAKQSRSIPCRAWSSGAPPPSPKMAALLVR
jgi:hypothetical protein